MGRPNKYKGVPRPELRGPRPHTWCTGPDPQRHDQFISWQRHKAQARFRNEPWSLSFEDYELIWGDLWTQRGRGRGDLMLVRRDWHRPWVLDNLVIADRQYYHWRQNEIKREAGRIQNNNSSYGRILRDGRDL